MVLCLNDLGGKTIKLNDGTERKFINDNDTVIMKVLAKKLE
jgi:hypothetical protein